PGAKAPPAAAPRSLKTFGEETAAASSPPPRPRPAPDRPSAARSRTWPYGASPTEDDDAYGLADLPPPPPRAAVSARDDAEFLPPGELKPVKSRPKKKRNRSGGEVIAFFSGVPGQFYLYYLGVLAVLVVWSLISPSTGGVVLAGVTILGAVGLIL